MGKHRRAAKIDNNQTEIVKALREIPGVSVEVGHDDIIIGVFGFNFWIELKDERALDKDGNIRESEIKPSQKVLRDTFKGQYDICSSFQQIFDIIQAHLTKYSKHFKEFKSGK